MTGRPPVIQREYIDCKFPTPTTFGDEEEGEEREAVCERVPLPCPHGRDDGSRWLTPSSSPPPPLPSLLPFLFAVENWGFRFALTCVAEVASKTLMSEAPSYETIMELDRKVREYPIPPDAAAFQEDLETPPDSEPPPLQEGMIRFVLAHSREVSECPKLFLLSTAP